MKEILDAKTLEALRHYGDDAATQFYAHLRDRRFMSTRCSSCELTSFPPRSFCPECHGAELNWVELPRRGTVYAFTQQKRTFRFMAPDVIGLVELADVGKVLTHFDAPYDALQIGQPVELDFLEISDDLVVHQFRPTDES